MDVPSDCSAHVELSTATGSVSTNVPVPNWGPLGLGKKLSFDVGAGGATVRAILDQSHQTDLDTALAMLSLLERGYLVVG